ncbi:IMPACT family protein [Sphingobacterium hungaricum]|uniref:YigZ family protein n=1 Tax=Sphingobacterium hungaricum TaxID=2082723 RepID=A0A928UYI5_9SPHI|nr:YigZ family protein [Sphingobacterium hungaricum]MBE8715373.1 YigZ family protein [Sphingobacterium hungaricum]
MSLFEDTYQTIENKSEGIFRDKGSKFLAYAFPFRDEAKLKEILSELREQHPKARHFCYGYRLTVDRSVYRVNDDGEPSGTAGRPIVNVLLSKDLTNILVVVVRYFGGTLLGVPGLINAYKMATIEAIEQSQIIEMTVNDVYKIHFEYLQLNDVMRVIKEEDITVINQQFDLDCEMQIEMRQTQVEGVLSKLEKIENLKLNYLRTV